MDKGLLLQSHQGDNQVRFSICFMDRNSLSRPQECPREGDDIFGEELAGVAGAGFANNN